MNATLTKFGYPQTIIDSGHHWSVLLRPQQTTLGALILGSHSQATAFSELSEQEISALAPMIKKIETVLTRCFNYDKINYLMLMMVDPHVHFHVIPRYEKSREFDSVVADDPGWPGPPDLGQSANLSDQQQVKLLNYLQQQWVA